MAGQWTCYNFAAIGKNEFIERTSIEGSSTSTPSSTQTFTPAQAFALANASVSGLPSIYTNIHLQRVTKLALELFVKR